MSTPRIAAGNNYRCFVVVLRALAAAVRLTGGPPEHAQDLDAEYLRKLEPDRMVAYYRKRWAADNRGAVGRLGRRRQNPEGNIAGH